MYKEVTNVSYSKDAKKYLLNKRNYYYFSSVIKNKMYAIIEIR